MATKKQNIRNHPLLNSIIGHFCRLKGIQTQPSSTQKICGGSTLEMKLCTLISPQLAKKPLKMGKNERVGTPTP
jgi:hypothetical protein